MAACKYVFLPAERLCSLIEIVKNHCQWPKTFVTCQCDLFQQGAALTVKASVPITWWYLDTAYERYGKIMMPFKISKVGKIISKVYCAFASVVRLRFLGS